MKEKKNYQRDTVEFLKPTAKKIAEGTEFKGSKEIYVTRFAGKKK